MGVWVCGCMGVCVYVCVWVGESVSLSECLCVANFEFTFFPDIQSLPVPITLNVYIYLTSKNNDIWRQLIRRQQYVNNTSAIRQQYATTKTTTTTSCLDEGITSSRSNTTLVILVSAHSDVSLQSPLWSPTGREESERWSHFGVSFVLSLGNIVVYFFFVVFNVYTVRHPSASIVFIL